MSWESQSKGGLKTAIRVMGELVTFRGGQIKAIVSGMQENEAWSEGGGMRTIQTVRVTFDKDDLATEPKEGEPITVKGKSLKVISFDPTPISYRCVCEHPHQ